MPDNRSLSNVNLLPPIVALMAGRGGTGKTSVSVNVASLIAETGNNVLIVDLDLSAQGATHLISKYTGSLNCKTVVDALDDIIEPASKKTKRTTPKSIWNEGLPLEGPALLKKFNTGQVLGALYFLPARPGRLQYTRHKIAEYGAVSSEKIADLLRSILQTLSQHLDLKCIIIDCPAASDNFSEAAAMLADYAIIVTQPDRPSRQAAADLEGVLLHNIPSAQRPYIGWVINKIMANYTPVVLRTIFQEVNVLAYIPFEERIAAAYGEIPFARQLGLSTFEIKLHLLCRGLFEDQHPHLVPDPVKMIPPGEMQEIRQDLKVRISRTARILMIALITSASIGLLCFILATISAIAAWLSGGPPKPIIDPNTGNITIPPVSAWYHKVPTEGTFIAGFILLLLSGVIGYFHSRQRQKEKRAEIEPTKLVRDLMLSTDKEDLHL